MAATLRRGCSRSSPPLPLSSPEGADRRRRWSHRVASCSGSPARSVLLAVGLVVGRARETTTARPRPPRPPRGSPCRPRRWVTSSSGSSTPRPPAPSRRRTTRPTSPTASGLRSASRASWRLSPPGPSGSPEIRPGVTPHYLSGIADQAGSRYVLSAQVEPPRRERPCAVSLGAPPTRPSPDSAAGRPASWDALDARATALAPGWAGRQRASNTTGGCGVGVPAGARRSSRWRSVMKLYVLGAVAEAVQRPGGAGGSRSPSTRPWPRCRRA